MANSFLVLVPHETLHGTISILIQRPKLATNVGKMGAVKNKMPFIPQCPGPAQSAAAEMPKFAEAQTIRSIRLIGAAADKDVTSGIKKD